MTFSAFVKWRSQKGIIHTSLYEKSRDDARQRRKVRWRRMGKVEKPGKSLMICIK